MDIVEMVEWGKGRDERREIEVEREKNRKRWLGGEGERENKSVCVGGCG